MARSTGMAMVTPTWKIISTHWRRRFIQRKERERAQPLSQDRAVEQERPPAAKSYAGNCYVASVDQRIVVPTRRVHRPTDARVNRVELYFLPVATRIPLKFGSETLTTVTCARVRIQLLDRHGRTAEGWGETPLSVQWAWPSSLSLAERHLAMVEFCKQLAEAWMQYENWGHPLETGNAFQRDILEPLTDEFNEGREPGAQMPHLAALVCCSAFDIALHDAYGALHEVPVYKTYNSQYMSCDLADFMSPAAGCSG